MTPVRCSAVRVARAVALVAVLAGALAGAAFAQVALERDPAWSEPRVGTPCAETGAVVELRGVGRATYDAIRVEGDRGRAVLDGGVCIELDAQEVRIRIAHLELAGLELAGTAPGDAVRVAAEDAVLDVAAWRLRAGSVRGRVDALEVRDVVLLGPGVLAVAEVGTLAGGEVRLTAVRAATDGYLFAADTAHLPPSGRLVLSGVEGTSCRDCPVRIRFGADRATADLDGGRLALAAPRLRVLGVPVPLGERLEVGAGVAEVDVPFDQREDDALGIVSTLRLRDSGGAELRAGTATAPTLAPVLRYAAEAGGDRIALAADAEGVTLAVGRAGPAAVGATTRVEAVADLAGADRSLRVGPAARWRGTSGGRATDVTTRVGLGVEAVVTPRDGATAPRAGVRVPAYAEVGATRDVAGLRLSGAARVDAQGTRVAGGSGGGVRAAATLRAGVGRTIDVGGGGGGTLDATLVRRWAGGPDPFGMGPEGATSRLELRSDLRTDALGSGADRATVRLRAYADVRLPPEAVGTDRLGVDAALDVDGAALGLGPDAESFRARLAVRADAAGRFGGDADEDGWTVAVRATWPEAGEASLRVGRTADAPIAVTLAAARRFVLRTGPEGGRVELTPTLGVDVAPWLRGEGPPRGVRHGLRVASADCCGRVAVGYVAEDGEVRVDVGVTLPPLALEGPPPLRLPARIEGYGGTP